MSEQISIGDEVQWTHIRQNGSSIHMSAMEGKVVEINGLTAVVKQAKSGRKYTVMVARLRSMDQMNELTELVMRQKKAVDRDNG